MLFVGAITLTGSYEMFWTFLAQAATVTAGDSVALYVDAFLVVVVAMLGVIVLSDSMKQWYGYIVLKRPFTSSEVVVMAGSGSAGRLRTAIACDEKRFSLPPQSGCC